MLKCTCFVTGLLDTITSTADSKDCPGVCVHTLATLICYEVLEDVVCPSPSMRCCVEPPPSNTSLPPPKGEAQSTATTIISSTGQPTRRPQVRMPLEVVNDTVTIVDYVAGALQRGSRVSLVRLAHVTGASCACHWCVSRMSLVRLVHVTGASCACHWCVLRISQVRLVHVTGASCACHWCVLRISLVRLAHVTGASRACHYSFMFKIFVKILKSIKSC
jgi:hypothetical protein